MFEFIFPTPIPIDRYELPDIFGKMILVIDTCGGMTDSDHFYETGISHISYNNGDWIIVEGYDTEEDARNGHNKWVKIMTDESLPAILNDVSTSFLAKALDEFSSDEKSFRCNPFTIDITPEILKNLPESTKEQ
jgi:hypothetical protein